MVHKFIIKRERDNKFLALADEINKLVYPGLKYTFQPESSPKVLTFETEEEANEALNVYKQHQSGVEFDHIRIIKI